MKNRQKWFLGMIVVAFLVCFVPDTVHAASKKANYQTITSQWKKIQGDYYRREGGTVYFKSSRYAVVEEVFLAEISAAYTNGYYVYIYGVDGAFNNCIVRCRRATKAEKRKYGTTFMEDKSWCFTGVFNEGNCGECVDLTNQEIPLIGRQGNNIWMLVGKPTGIAQKNYVYSFNMKTGKCKKIRLKLPVNYACITITDRYVYGKILWDGVVERIAIIDRKTGKSFRSKWKVLGAGFRNGKIYTTQVKKSKDGKTTYHRSVTLSGNGQKILKAGKWYVAPQL